MLQIMLQNEPEVNARIMASIQFPKGPLPPGYLEEDRSYVVIIVGVLFMVLEIAAFGLGAASRLLIPYGGVGHHTLVVAQKSPEKFPFLGSTALIIGPALYIFAVNLSKGAILQMFLRIFTVGWARRLTKVVGVILILQTVVIFFTLIFQCKPISLIWKSLERNSCIDIGKFFAYASIPNIATDLAMLILPMPTIWNLKATVQLKLCITLTILTASIGIITSILRTVGFFIVKPFEDPAWILVNLLAYSIAEPGTYFLAACFPTYRPLIAYIKGGRIRSAFSARYWTGSKRYRNHTKIGGENHDGKSKERVPGRSEKVAVYRDSIALVEVGRVV
ncbi:hypothetical protein HYFRA_00009035 [Hymenoscyphus fraxineus]|uniref:Rhodopsin domain-containing protein n=1 Tax=Hymenoscyphus fraxineus TaxID=746836 RepID=A0A9N9PR61_9HELO|nr:hypothetical protein HYFRA_00009035 [Hymenoscyphus fraxineus]